MRRAIEVEGLGHRGQPIPVASLHRGILASGGIAGIDRKSGELTPDRNEQVRLVFENVRAVLTAAGATVDDVVKMTFFVTDRALRDAVNAEWTAMFPDPGSRPARHTLTQQLPPGMAVQCELLAVPGAAPRAEES
ncbi:RidA family protein [Streptomyces sp. NPDC001315]|uniref:RidA family protein n=1 Tax=Streptomyces sp. NPDC001315 TaxID=3364562 RepID=UPI0036C265BB